MEAAKERGRVVLLFREAVVFFFFGLGVRIPIPLIFGCVSS